MATPTQIEELLRLLDAQSERIQRAFVLFVETVRSPAVTDEVLRLLENHDVAGALKIVDSYVTQFGNVLPEVMNTVGSATAAELSAALPYVALAIGFDATHPRAATLAAQSRTRLIRDLTLQQHAATQQAISRSIARGAGAQATARAFRDSIGLTAHQEAFVDTYRQQLESLDSRALGRALRDQRFDGRISTAIQRDRPLTQLQIDTMVDRYRARALAMRAETVARTEALRAYSQAREESLQQMISQTGMAPERVQRVWHATHDSRVREWHLVMEGQKAGTDDPFLDGLGNSVMFPGDPTAPPETVINCRCTLSYEIAPPG